MDTSQFRAHQALPEELAHKIFEAIDDAVQRASMTPVNPGDMELHTLSDDASARVQQAVAEAYSELIWKLLNRKRRSHDR